MDMIINGQAQGSIASRLLQNNMDVGVLRPWIGKDGRTYIANRQMNSEGKLVTMAVPVNNANATLRKDEWKIIDDSVAMAAKERLTIVADIRSRGLVYNVPNGMGTTVLETQRMGDITPATISMDPSRKSEADRPEFDIIGLPLPVIHKDFFFTARQIAVSRKTGQPIDTTTAQLATRRVAEEAEKLVLGVSGSYAYGGYTLYGLTNFPSRLTKTLTAPTAGGYTPATTILQLLDMRQKSMDALNFGPWVLYISPAWDQYLDRDYSSAYPGGTLRERILKTNGITGIVPAYFLTGFQILMVQMTSDVIREVIGMDITTLQWETNGGMEVHFKVMAIMVPQIRADQNNNTGIVHGASA